MEATVAGIRGFVRRQIKGERVWRIGVSVTPQSARVTLLTPDKPYRFLEERDKDRPPIVEELERKLESAIGRDVVVGVVQSPMAIARHIRISPRKVRHVVDAIRGKHVQDALAILQFVPNAAAKTVTKLLKSAIANAENNHRMDSESLEVIHVHVDEGTTLKRVSPRAMGRAYRIVKRTSHITVGLGEAEKPARVGRGGRGIARTVGKAPRRGARAEGARPQRPAREATAARAAEAPGAEETKASGEQQEERGGGE